VNAARKNVRKLWIPTFPQLVVGLAMLTGLIIALFCLTHTVFAAEDSPAVTPRWPLAP